MVFPLSSMLTGLLRNLIFTPIYAARCLKIRWNRFYGDILLGWISIGSIVILGNLSRMVFPVDSWIKLILTCLLYTSGLTQDRIQITADMSGVVRAGNYSVPVMVTISDGDAFSCPSDLEVTVHVVSTDN